MNNSAPVDFDDFSEKYNLLLSKSTAFFSKREEYFARYKVGIISRESNPHEISRVLEYGCGIGRNLRFLEEAFPHAKIEACDISKKSLELAKRNNPRISFFLESEMTDNAGQYDLVFVAGVFHHVPQSGREPLMRKIFSRCSAGGTAFFFEHNPWNPVTRMIVRDCEFDRDAVLLRSSELIELARLAGFVRPKRRYCLIIPPCADSWLFIEEKLGWFPLGGQYWVKAFCPK